MQSYWHLRKTICEATIKSKRNFEMTTTNIQTQVAAAFAALFAAAVLVSASIGPAVNSAASLVA